MTCTMKTNKQKNLNTFVVMVEVLWVPGNCWILESEKHLDYTNNWDFYSVFWGPIPNHQS